MENFRRAIGLRIKEVKEVYEGEVTELTPSEVESAVGGYGRTIEHVIIGLKTTKGTKQLKLVRFLCAFAAGGLGLGLGLGVCYSSSHSRALWAVAPGPHHLRKPSEGKSGGGRCDLH